MLFFMNMMKIASFRRCVFDEVVESNGKIYAVYSGQIGCLVLGLNYLLTDS